MPQALARAFVGVGANLGDARKSVLAAIQALDRIVGCRLGARSPLYRSAPLQAQGPDFINAVAELHTTLEAQELLHRLQAIEDRFGRVRSERNAPRTLDLDLLLHGDTVLRSPDLVLPHPRAHLRAFVLLPLADIDATLRLPGLGPIGRWLPGVADQAIERIDAG